VLINPREGSFISDMSKVDPVVRLYSYRQSLNYGYTVNVGLSLDAALRSWRQQVVAVSSVIAVFAIILLLMTRKIHRAWNRDAAMISALEANTKEIKQKHWALIDSEFQHRALLEKLYTAIVVHAPDTRIIFSNFRAAELLGLTEIKW